jgi:hypothetical protein
LKSEQFTEVEELTFASSWPLRMIYYDTLATVKEYKMDSMRTVGMDDLVELNSFYLSNVTKSKRFEKPLLVDFTFIQAKYVDLIRKASELRFSKTELNSKLGIFRLGSFKKLPLYYIHEPFDLAGFFPLAGRSLST